MEVDGEEPPGRHTRWLAILAGPHPPLDQAPELGPLAELGDTAEVHVLRTPTLDELAAAAKDFGPTAVYAYGGTPGRSEDVERQSVAPLGLLMDEQGGIKEEAVDAFASAFTGLSLDVLFLDFAGSAAVASALQRAADAAGSDSKQPPRHLIVWPAGGEAPALAALDFAHSFLGLLRTPGVSVPEAYALAAHMTKAHGTVVGPAPPANGAGDPAQPAAQEPAVPQLLALAAGTTAAADAAANGVQPAALVAQQPPLPATASVPALELEGVDLSKGLAAAFPGYADLRLLAPNAELRLLQAGISSMVNPHNLRFLGEALRALLTLEVRQLEVAQLVQQDRPPAQLPGGAAAVRCEVRTPSGATATVTLGGPADLLKNKALVQHALRQAMTADAQTLQFKLPPAGVPLPPTHVSPGVASGAPVVEGLAVTSLWTVQLLKLLAQEAAYRGLVLLGVAAVGTSPVAALGPSDAALLAAVVTQNDPSKATAPPPAALPIAGPAAAAARLPQSLAAAAAAANARPQAMEGVEAAAGGLTPAGSNAAAAAAAAGGRGATPGSSGPSGGGRAAAAASPPELTSGAAGRASLPPQQSNAQQQAQAAPPPLPWKSSRPPLPECSEAAFMSDLIAFLTERQGRQIDPRTFPEAILNGSKLDLFHLYKEVCSRGGYKVGNGINWKGQVFPRMRNFTPNHRMTGVGNALKRHYQVLLLDYEQVHPDDITGDRCGICGRGDEHASDWISCDGCNTWVHFSCDERMTRVGTFKDYAKGKGRSYHCPRCTEQRAMQAQAAQVLAQVLASAQQQQQAGGGPAPMQE